MGEVGECKRSVPVVEGGTAAHQLVSRGKEQADAVPRGLLLGWGRSVFPEVIVARFVELLISGEWVRPWLHTGNI